MIIVNQERNVIVNFDNVESVDIVADLDGTGKVLYKIYYVSESSREELGIYKTEGRAKEVLQEIINAYCCTKILQLPNVNYKTDISGEDMVKTIAYEMPEE